MNPSKHQVNEFLSYCEDADVALGEGARRLVEYAKQRQLERDAEHEQWLTD